MKKPKKKNGHGGPRRNAGRPEKEKTVVMRVRLSKVEKVRKINEQA